MVHFLFDSRVQRIAFSTQHAAHTQVVLIGKSGFKQIGMQTKPRRRTSTSTA
jgi:hypothetical protein